MTTSKMMLDRGHGRTQLANTFCVTPAGPCRARRCS
jgi:hypothetical protein